MRLEVPFIIVALAVIAAVNAETNPEPDLAAEHRSAKAEPFLEKLASALGFGSSNEKQYRPPNKPIKKANRPKPVYKRPPKTQQTLPSVHKPVVASRPTGGYGAPQAPPLVSRPQQPRPPAIRPPIAPAASNSFPTYFGGGGGSQGGFGGGSSSSFGGGSSGGSSQFDPWQVAQPANMAQIRDLQVQCEKDLMRVRVIFDRPFYGMIFSKGHYSNANCVHVPSGLGQTQATFDIALRSCGMSASSNDGYTSPTPQGSHIENTIIIQYDPLLQEVWDQARKLRCTWYDFYEKAVTFKPYQVDMLDPVTANFLGDNLRCWMQIQVGKGPHASEVSGIVKIGQTMTMVLGVKDDENKFDMMVRNCVAHDGQRSPIQLVDEKGCVVRPKIMSPFKKIKNFDSTANVLSYAYFQAFKFPDSMNVHFQCVVQVCRGSCPNPQCGGSSGTISSTNTILPSAVPNTDGYGSPQAPAVDSYGSPQGNPIGAINPRLPTGGSSVYQPSGSERRVSIVKPDGSTVTDLQAPEKNEEPDRVVLSEPGYEGLTKRLGHPALGEKSRSHPNHRSGPLSLGGRPRSLEPEDMQELNRNALPASGANVVDSAIGEDAHNIERREAEAEPRILRVVRREATEMADLQTEKIIQVLAPNDVQFALTGEDKEEVVINTTSGLSQSVCIDTPAFVGVTVSFLMILIIALITIVFLWMRIKSLDSVKKKKSKTTTTSP